MTTSVLPRFLKYVTFDTKADDTSSTYPSTPGQLVLLRVLADELRALGLSDVVMDEHGYVMATIPATSTKANVPTVGFIAHVDTSPEMPGDGVKPIVHKAWDGSDIVLPDHPTAVLRAADMPYLGECVGHDIVTASGTTLLGADNKSGVAAIMAATEYLVAHPEIPHGTIRIGFTPDEEIGKGVQYFDVKRFDAHCAYTMDGGARGEVEYESFSADGMAITFTGFNTHPGYAKGKMINSIKLAAKFLASLPDDRLSPETTSAREGFVHPNVVDASVERTTVKFIIRDFVTAGLKEKEDWLTGLAQAVVKDVPGASVEVKITEQYRNMREVLDHHPQIVDNAREAIRRIGVGLRERPIRGGTDGSRLSFMGLPTPNVFVGEQNFHSRYEWVSVQDMEKAVEAIVEIAKVWEERA